MRTPGARNVVFVALLCGAVYLPACAGGAANGPTKGPVVDPPPPPPTAPNGDLPEAPIAGPQACPAGTQSLVEEQTLGELRSCIVPGKEYRNTPHRHGPYELIGPGGKLLMLGEWRDNQQEGVWRFWHPNGKLKRETSYRNGAPVADANWDDAGRQIDQRDGSGMTTWYPNGHKQSEQRATGEVTEGKTWFENGRPEKEIRQRNGRWDGVQSEWFDNGQKKQEADYRAGKLADWKGWSSTGRELTDDSCVEDADCVGVIKPGECYACVPPYEAITRWREAQRTMRPPPQAKGCDPGPFACAGLPQPPSAFCKSNRCTLNDR